MGLGNHGDDVLDFLFQTEGWPGGQKQHGSLAPHTDIFQHYGMLQPVGHRLVFTLQANPPWLLTVHRRQACDQAEPTLNLGSYERVVVLSRLHFIWSDGFQQGATMRRASCHRQVAEVGPHLIPGHLSVVCVMQRSRSHWGGSKRLDIAMTWRKHVWRDLQEWWIGEGR